MEPPSPRLQVRDDVGVGLREERLRSIVAAALPGVPAEVGLWLTDDASVRDLNRRFRGRDASTDVLTFPLEEGSADGEIAVSVPYAGRQAARRGVSLEDEIGYLVLHGALHLRGLDDETDAERRTMQAEMNRLALLVGLPPDPAWFSLPDEGADA